MKTKFTQGQWQMIAPSLGDKPHIATFVNGDKIRIAECNFDHIRQAIALEGSETDIPKDYDFSYNTEIANATLIAAAPDMLAVLEKVKTLADEARISLGAPLRMALNKAIEKAVH